MFWVSRLSREINNELLMLFTGLFSLERFNTRFFIRNLDQHLVLKAS